MKKIIRLTENDLTRLVKRVIKENKRFGMALKKGDKIKINFPEGWNDESSETYSDVRINLEDAVKKIFPSYQKHTLDVFLRSISGNEGVITDDCKFASKKVKLDGMDEFCIPYSYLEYIEDKNESVKPITSEYKQQFEDELEEVLNKNLGFENHIYAILISSLEQFKREKNEKISSIEKRLFNKR